MATAQEKEALGLGPDASDEDVAAAIASLKEKAAAEPEPSEPVDVDAIREEARRAAQAEADERVEQAQSDAEERVNQIRSQVEADRAGSVAADQEAPSGPGTEVKIAIRAFPYYRDVPDPLSGEPERREFVAVRGETVRLNDTDLARARRFNAVVDPDEEVASASPEPRRFPENVSIEDATVPELSEWITREKPTVEEVVDEANAEPAYAQKLLDAEDHATGQQSRPELKQELQEIIDSHNA